MERDQVCGTQFPPTPSRRCGRSHGHEHRRRRCNECGVRDFGLYGADPVGQGLSRSCGGALRRTPSCGAGDVDVGVSLGIALAHLGTSAVL